MAFAVAIEGVACFCRLLALKPAEVAGTTIALAQEVSHALLVPPITPASTTVATGGNDVTRPKETASSRASDREDDMTLVLTAIRDGTVRGTVAEIRKHLGCSQA